MKSFVAGLLIFLPLSVFAENTVTITVKDKSLNLWLNVFYSQHQLEAELFRIGKEYKINTIRLNCDSTVRVSTGVLNSYFFDYTFRCGDSILVTKGANGFPYFTIVNRTNNETELNFDYWKISKGKSRKEHTVSANEILSMERQVDYLLDSLYARSVISEPFYRYQKRILPVKTNTEIITRYKVKGLPIPLDSLHSIPLFADSLAEFKEYINYLYNYVRFIKMPGTQIPSPQQCFDYVFSETEGKVREQLLYTFLKSIYYNDQSALPAYFEKFKTVAVDPQLIHTFALIVNKGDEEKEFISASLKNSGMLRNENKTELFSFDSLVSRYKGSVVYIDFWASWCAPCRAQMAHSKQLKEIFKGEKFEVVYISIDEKFSPWKKSAREFNLTTGNSFILMDPRRAELTRMFRITAIPRYMLLDKNGNLVNKDARFPGDRQLLTDIRRLLK